MTLARYLVAAVSARLADEGARVAIVLLALDRTGDAGLGGLLIAALMVPHVLAAPLAGAAADRARRRKPLYAAALVWYALALAGSAALIGRLEWAAAALLATAGCLSPLMLGGLSSLLGELAPENRQQAFSLDAGSYGTAGIIGPALAAVIAGWAGAAWAMVTLGAFVVLGAALLVTLPLPARPRPARPADRGSALAGFAVIVRRRRLAAATVTSTLQMLGFGALPLAAASIAGQRHNAALTGLLMSGVAVGGLAGSVLCTRLPVVHRVPEKVLILCTAVMTAPLLLTALSPPAWALVTLFALAGICTGPSSVAVFSIRDREAPPELRTQVFTLGAGFKVTAGAAGAAAGGLLASHSPAVLLAAIAACTLIGAVVGSVVLPRADLRPSGSRSSTGATQRSSP